MPVGLAIDPPALPPFGRSRGRGGRRARRQSAWKVGIAHDGSGVTVRPLERAVDVPEDRRNACRYALCRVTAQLPSGASKEYILCGVQRE